MMGAVAGSLVSGALLGVSAGVSPGPLLTLVMSETLKHGPREGIKIAFSPLFTDIPIVALAVLGISRLSGHLPLMGVVSLLGGLFSVYLGYGSLMFKGAEPTGPDLESPKSLRMGVIANLLNPSPYLFWVSIGAPLMVDAWRSHPAAAVAFISAFYALLVGSKVFIALTVGKSRALLNRRCHVLVVRGLGIALLIFAALFLKKAYFLLMPP
ncbi:LysE family translocator [Desulfococcus sp.]|uniref:LysE family translocator n=1 Tax=Desulfococcus sp. TaxID=2025834 RepID=UPI0035943569